MKDNMLEVGDQVYRVVGFNMDEIYLLGAIDRVTPRQAMIRNRKFKRETKKYSDGTIELTELGSPYTKWSKPHYYLLTDSVKEQYAIQKKRESVESRVREVFQNNLSEALRRLSLARLERIVDILEETPE